MSKAGSTRVWPGSFSARSRCAIRLWSRKQPLGGPARGAVGIDARKGMVAVEGWAETSELSVIELAKRFEGAGVAAIIYTDIDRDGVLAGINWESTLELARATSIPVIASGGLASMADIERMTQPEFAVLEGAISGRALYDGRIDSREALALLRADQLNRELRP
ncbi:HisA/HisF-related TIM barrel protein [Devosia sp. A8/3-2]|nr:HisA/HisF-related TIM barrel protein [Devosia sp. A8/3-2]